MLKIRTILLSIVLVLILMLTAQLVTARTEVVSDPASDLAGVSNHQEQSANQNIAPVSSYRSPLDECYDVPLREAAGCRKTSQAPIPSYRSPLDVCFDVPLNAATACRLAEQADAP